MEDKIQNLINKIDESVTSHDYEIYEDNQLLRIDIELSDLRSFVEQELDRTREEVITEIYNFVEGESGRSGRKEILEFISKLTTK